VADRTVSIDLFGRDRMSPALNSASRAASRADGAFGKAGKTFARAGAGIARIAGRASLAVGALAVTGGAFGLKIAASNEQAQISFTTMLGSARKARRFLGELQKFAAKTPFEFPELQTAASSLISAGFHAKQVIPIMTTLGDVTSGMGTGSEGIKRATVALQQMSAAGKITAEDLNQLRDAGVPVFDLLASATGKSKAKIAEMAAAGKLGKTEMDKLFQALEKGGGGLKRFSGLMDKQSQSLTGLWSTFKDTLGQGLAKAITPMIPTIKRALKSASGLIGTTLANIPAAVARIKGFAGPIVAKIRDALPAIKAAFKTWGSALADVFAFVKVDVVPIVAQIAGAAAAASKAIIAGIRTGMATGDWSSLGVTLGAGLGTALTAALAGGSKITNAFAGIDWASAGAKAASAAVPFVIGFVGNLINALVEYTIHHPLDMALFILTIIPVGKGAGLILKLGEKLGGKLTTGVTHGALSGLSKAADGIWTAVKWLVRGAIKVVERLAPGFVLAIRHAMTAVVHTIDTFIVKMAVAGGRLIRGLIHGVNGMIDDAIVGVRLVIAKMVAPFKGAGKWLFSAGVNLIKGLISGIGSMFGAVKGKLGDLTGKLTSWKGPPSKDRKLLVPAGINIMEGLNAGLVTGSKKIKRTLQTLTENIRSHLSDLRSQARDIASAAADSVRGILDVSAIGGQGGSASATLAGFAAQAGAFAKALARMAKIGLAPAIIAAVAAAGPSALGAANAFASETKAQVRSDNASMAAIDKAARSVGATALASSSVPKQIAETNHLLRQLTHVLGDKNVKLRITKGGDLIVEYVNAKNRDNKRR
jgi:tape measure domain-containing protein